MITAALPRWIAQQLADPDFGVNALRASVPRDEIDPVPPPVSIYNAIDDDWVARKSPTEGVTPDEWVLHVNVGESIQLAGDPDAEGNVSDSADVVIHLAGVTLQGKNAAALAAAHRLMRAVRRCLLHAFRGVRRLDPPALVLEGQRIEMPAELALLIKEHQPGSGAVDLALVIPFDITDEWALGAPEI